MPHRLSPDQVEFFNEQGYLIFDEPVFRDEDFRALRDHFEQMLERWTATQSATPEHMDVPHFADPGLFRWLLDDQVLDIVEPLTGPDIALWSSHFICKPASTGKRVPWHEDSAYWGKALDPMEVVTIWLAIDPSTTENGCMRVIPGTHRDGYSEYDAVQNAGEQVFGTEIKADQMDESKAVDLVLEPNQCSIHHAKLIHGSHANTGAMRRCGYTMRYVPATSYFDRDSRGGGRMDHFQIYLARGEDKAGNSKTLGDPTKANLGYVEYGATV